MQRRQQQKQQQQSVLKQYTRRPVLGWAQAEGAGAASRQGSGGRKG